MALGCARLFNIDLTPNFNRPYLAESIADFWRRWHISFSSWILDYVFKPLQMKWRRSGRTGSCAAILITFLVTGIWHGAKWGFVAWGLLHGLYLVFSTLYRPFRSKMSDRPGKRRIFRSGRIFFTFNLVSFAWIFFRANNLRQAGYIIFRLFWKWDGLRPELVASQGPVTLCVLLTALSIYWIVKAARGRLEERFKTRAFFRWMCYYGLVLCIILFAVRSKASFIYLGF
jgi:alginate O-acetyltransferase complex protein AlgI